MFNSMPSEQQIAEAMEKVLSRREFSWLDTGPVEEAAVRTTERALSSGQGTMGGLGYLVMILLAAAAVYLLIRMLYAERRYRLGSHEKHDTYEQPVSADPLFHAQALALKQDFSGALIALFALHLHMLQQQGWLVLDESKTGLQYQWELCGQGYGDVQGFEAFRKVFNRVRYGGYCELKETYEKFLAYCRQDHYRRRPA